MASNNAEVGHAILRVFLGLLFLVPGLNKLMAMLTSGTHPVMGLLNNSLVLVWLLIIVEVVCGLALILGYKTKWVVWPLSVVLLVALFMVALNPLDMISLLFHLTGIAGLVSLYFTGPGLYAVQKD